MKQKIALSIAFLAVIIYFTGLYFDNYLLRLIAKPIPILAFITLLKPTNHYVRFIFIGLGFSVIGDFLLESSPAMFLFGLIAFLIAHLFYIGAFYKRNHIFYPIPLIMLTLYGVIVYYMLYPYLGDMAIPVLIYLIVILIMSWRAIAQSNYNQYAIYAAVGSLFFVISDSLIAFNKFYVEIPMARWMIMFTYWTAQSLIFYSAFKSESKR